jgi:uncharacterized protein
VSRTLPVSLEEKLEFLRQPSTFPDAPASVETIETHFAWVFLSTCFVYKLKKPIRSQVVDFTNLHARRANCELEITLNRRLAEAVYIGVVPLCRTSQGLLCLGGEGEPVEWLVKMHRLPRESSLDRAAARGMVTEAMLRALVTKLARFYRETRRAPLDGPQYRQRLDRQARRYAGELAASTLGLGDLATHILARQRRIIQNDAALLEQRAVAGRVVDAHGDLRPEHVYLGDEPQIIDCLEFSTELRWLDTAEEITFLAFECERMGHSRISDQIHGLYAEICEDPVPPGLLALYRSQRALVRALLAAWHVQGGEPTDVADHWRERARWYLHAAAESLS